MQYTINISQFQTYCLKINNLTQLLTLYNYKILNKTVFIKTIAAAKSITAAMLYYFILQ